MNGRLAGDWWVENLLRPVLIAAMLVCLAAPPVLALEWIVTGWDGTGFLFFAFLAGLEGIWSERLLQKQRISGWGYLASRGAEALILLLLLKLLNAIPLGLERLWAEVTTWTMHPTRLVNDLDLLTGSLFLPLWLGSLYVGRLVRELDVPPDQAAPPADKTSTAYYLWLTQPSPVRDRQERLDWLGEAFVWGGIALLLASAVVYRQLPESRSPALPTLLYFALGVALLSQARFSVAHAGWQRQGIPVQPGIGRRWLVWALLFLVGVALIALLLPTSYALGPVQALLTVIGLIIQALTLIVAVLLLLFSLLLSLFLPDINIPQPSQPALPLPPAGESPSTSAATLWLEPLLSALFWLTMLAIVGYALIHFLRERLGLLAIGEGGAGSGWGRFLAWLGLLWHKWRAWRQGVQAHLARRRAERRVARSLAPRPFRYLSLRRLSPRDRIRFFYLSTARRAAEAGQPRRPGQTPYEYQSALEGHFPEVELELTGLTAAFVEARYNDRPVEQEEAEAVKPLWQRIRAVLRRRMSDTGYQVPGTGYRVPGSGGEI